MEDEMSNGFSRYLTFRLGQESYAVDVAHVREILDRTAITRVPNSPEFMRGVINLRGSVVPVVDMRMKFGMSPIEEGISTCIIVVEIPFEDEKILIGALADSVQEVLELGDDQIESTPGFGTSCDCIGGMGKRDGEFIMILDIDKVFTLGDTLNLSGRSGS